MLSKIWYCEVCDHEYCLAGETQHLKTVKHNKNFLNRPLELDHLESEDESIVLICLILKVPMKRIFFSQIYGKMCEYECLIRKTG